MISTIGRICLFLGISILFVAKAHGQPSPYFPEYGSAAVAQRSLDVRNPAVVVALWLEPGYEDFSALAYLRLGLGVRVISIYATNGSVTPSDENDGPPFAVASMRREEAYRAMSRINVEPYFLCLPDIGVASDEHEVLSLWNADTVAARLKEVIRLFRPDIVLVGRDLRSDSGKSPRYDALVQLVEQTVAENPAGKGLSQRSWTPLRTLIDRGSPTQPVRAAGGSIHPVWKESFAHIGLGCLESYQSLRGQMPWMQRSGERSYSPSGEKGGNFSRGFLDGVQLFTPGIQRTQRVVDRAARVAVTARWQEAATRVTGAIDSVSRHLAQIDFQQSPRERRILVAWKINLEVLRCAVLGVRVTCVMSESLLTSRQLVFFTIDSVRAYSRIDSLEILFPSAVNREWIINETGAWRIRLTPSEEFRVLSPEIMEISYPASVEATRRTRVRTSFPFMIFHQDRVRSRSFAYRGVYDFRVGPLHSCEILTPIVRATSGARVAFSAMSFSRDPSRNAMVLIDSLVTAAPHVLYFKGKDAVVNDTLSLTFSEKLPEGDHRVAIKIGKKVAGEFVVRKFTALADTVHPVGIVSGLRTSALGDALERLHIRVHTIKPAQVRADVLGDFRTIVIDRDALVLREDLQPAREALLDWVRAGGRLVVMPQYSAGTLPVATAFEFPFEHGGGSTPNARLLLDSGNVFLKTPNMIGEDDWSGWVVARAFGTVRVREDSTVNCPVRDATTGMPLLVSVRRGAGRITFVALDLISQLVNVHPGAHRLLANLVWPD